MRGLVVSWMSLVASATAAVSGISNPAMTSGMALTFREICRTMDRMSGFYALRWSACGAAFVWPGIPYIRTGWNRGRALHRVRHHVAQPGPVRGLRPRGPTAAGGGP
ncbi:hypothetical protein GCM10027612_23590 [Microbispora bryophytorum subsp. camponoti]